MHAITYLLTRNTNCSGELSPSIECWYRRPIRCKLSFERGYVWLPSRDPSEPATKPGDLGLYGSYSIDAAKAIFKTIPDTDLEMIKCNTQVK